ncbi:hypothetical protein AAG570_003092 [Ranatra chinensis]|uniref:Replication factor C subunit 2 n=1 Tax=Ranatra chinensis TaxID=642074 RepID=A0ABD0Y5S3_9HEMI
MQAFLKSGKLSSKDESGASSSGKKSEAGRDSKRPTPWVEKYRPRNVEDVVEQKEIVSVLKECLNGADLPHLLFYGPPGTGKTSTILAAARQLFGDIYRERILELNASDDRGIQVIRDKVKAFSQLSASSHRKDGRPCPPFKIIILDEADSMTHAAQAALRRTMEKETKTTRFCLICNYISCIIPPLTSRCSKFRFKPLGEAALKSRLEYICREEGVEAEKGAVSALVEASGGDLRTAITWLQSCARLEGGLKVTVQGVFQVSGRLPSEWVVNALATCASNDYSKMDAYVENLIREGYCAPQLLDQLQEAVISSEELSDKAKAVICERVSITSWRLQEGASEYIQLMDLVCAVAKALQ